MRAAFEHGMSAEGDADSFLAGLFVRDVKRLPLLSKDEESILMKRSATGDKGAEKKLIESNLRFVLKTAFSYYRPGLSLMDMIQEGCIGLMRAVRKSDPSFDCRLVSYAALGIRGKVLRAIAYDKRHHMESLDDVIVNDDMDGGGERTLLDVLASEKISAEEAAFINHLVKMETLNTREKAILKMHYWQDLTLEEIGRTLNLSADHIARIKKKALFKLRWGLAGISQHRRFISE